MSPAEFHPDLRHVARHLPKQIVTPVTVPFIRAAERLLWRGTPADVEVLTLPSGAGVRLFRPAGATGRAPALLWIHGGGYVIGKAAQDDALCRRFARELGATVASVEYRLAPEHPYPVPLDDCYSALAWLVRCLRSIRRGWRSGAPARVGGWPPHSPCTARDRGEIRLAAQLLVYPMLDDRTVDRKGLDNPGLRLWNQSSNKFGWSAYLGGADPEVAVPARRRDLSGLPPAWLGVGTLDLFHDEDLAYAERLKAAGVRCEVEVVPGAFHGFDGIVPKAEVSQSFFDSQCALLREAFATAVA